MNRTHKNLQSCCENQNWAILHGWRSTDAIKEVINNVLESMSGGSNTTKVAVFILGTHFKDEGSERLED